MGMFLALSGVIGKTAPEVAQALHNYSISNGGGLERADLNSDHRNCCIIRPSAGGTTIFYPHYYTEWDSTSEYLSRDLQAPVFSFHIHDGDLWLYILYVNGDIADQFNPIPDYWDEDISQEEITAYKGDALVASKYVPGIQPQDIQRYLVRWDLDADPEKAYPDDEFTNEDWQLLDFMRRIGLTYPLGEDGKPAGEVYRLWTRELEKA